MIARLGDHGTQISLKLRERLVVHLPESRVSGYMWEYKHLCPCLRLDDSDYEEKGSARFNGSGARWWRFAAIATGECEMCFSLVRPWSKPAPEYILRVVVE